MSKKASISAHHLEFAEPEDSREIEIFYTEPSFGVNNETGLFLLIHGFGHSADSAYFKKLRKVWSTAFNVVAVSVNYLGTCPEMGEYYLDDENINKMLNKLTPEQ